MSDEAAKPAAGVVPRATYRLQLSKDFTFRDAIRILPYLAKLGISHVYCSPYLAARTGSPHGYDVVDHNAFNPEIGTRADFEAFVETLHAHGMGHILDFVPNHMGVGQSDNGWWLDVLEWGEASAFSDYFDINWQSSRPHLRGKLLLPFLGDYYGRVLKAGDLTLAFDADTGEFAVWYYEHKFPLAPHNYARVLLMAVAEMDTACAETTALAEVMTQFRGLRTRGLSKRAQAERRRKAGEVKTRLADLAGDAAVRAAIERAVAGFNTDGGFNENFRALHRLLNRQNYRLAFWRVAGQEINYRRFFDINGLAGLNVEKLALFDTIHDLVFSLMREGKLEGLRIDHIDGLFDPARYCRRLKERAGVPDFYLPVEKILAFEEDLPNWPVDGTTGYETAALMTGLFVDPGAESAINRIYRRFGGDPDFGKEVVTAKYFVMDRLLASEIQILAEELDRVSESHPDTRDFTLNDLHTALREVIAHFPVYRTYVTSRHITDGDRRFIERAITAAMRKSTLPDKAIFAFLHKVLTGDLVRRRGSGYSRKQVISLAMKVQQYTGPVTAKSVEDTTFYRYMRLISLNEVGSEPDHFGITPETFHHQLDRRCRRWPHAMVALATHDSKRGEDARARISALSLVPEAFSAALVRWRRMNRAKKALAGDRAVPAPPEEYFFYQSVIGAWAKTAMTAADLADLRERMDGFAVKALREAKSRTSWTVPDEAYEAAVRRFLANILDPETAPAFLEDFAAFNARLTPLARTISLAQTALHLTLPGVADMYQGAELWNHALVDPDNRRPVDYDARTRLLEAGPAWPDSLAADDTGLAKIAIIQRLLQERKDDPGLYRDGDYRPLQVEGPHAANVLAFSRRRGASRMIVVILRQTRDLLADDWAAMRGVLQDTAIRVPLRRDRLTDVLTGRDVPLHRAGRQYRVAAGDCFSSLPAAVLVP